MNKSSMTYTLEYEDGTPYNDGGVRVAYHDKNEAMLAAMELSGSNDFYFGCVIRVVEHVRNPLMLVSAKRINIDGGAL
jgi:hypothetical protein